MIRAQAELLLPELAVVARVLQKSKDREATMKRIATSIDWEAIDDAGNNIAAVLAAVRAGVKRVQV